MRETEQTYIQLGYKFEKATHPPTVRAIAEEIRHKIESERLEDRAEARRLIERGRMEARQ